MEEKILTGYPSIDKPWMKYYSEEAINAKIPECSVYEYILELNRNRLDKPALNYYGNKISYRDMFRRINQCAYALKALGVKEGEIISVSIPNTPEAVYLFYAISKIGAVANMIDPRSSANGIADYINETKSRKLFFVDIIAGKVDQICDKTSLETIVSVSPCNSLPMHLKALATIKNKLNNSNRDYTDWNDFIKTSRLYHKKVYSVKNCSDKPVLIVHTGGTTGSPKGVVLSNKNVNAIPFQSLQFPTDLQSNHIWLDIMPPFISYGIGSGLHFPLAIGQEVVLVPVFKPEELDKLILKYHPNHIAGAPSHWNSILKSKRLKDIDLSFLITYCVGGDTMNAELEKAANEFLNEHNCSYKIAKGYGMSEVNGSIGRTTNENNPIGSAGVPFAHSMVKVCDPETGTELQYNEIGEIYMSGPSVMLGYYNNKQETDHIKIKDEKGVWWIKSGDLGYMTEDGNIFIEGRTKRMIVRHDGFKIFPSMIENTINKNKSVIQSCVVGKIDSEHIQGKLPIVYAVLNESVNKATVRSELKALCEKELPEYVQPVDFVFIDEIPLTPIGKVDYRALERMAEEK